MHERVHSAPNHRRVAEKPSSKREATTAATGMKVVRKAPCRWICKRGQFDQFSPGRPCECGGSGGGETRKQVLVFSTSATDTEPPPMSPTSSPCSFSCMHPSSMHP